MALLDLQGMESPAPHTTAGGSGVSFILCNSNASVTVCL